MDSKNDDSSIGSDSLDKSLQQKCQVDDLAKESDKTETLIAELAIATSSSAGTTTEKAEDVFDTSQQQALQKTENYTLSDGINAAATEARVSSLRFFKPSSTISGTFSRVLDSDDDSDDDGESGQTSQISAELKSAASTRCSNQQKSTKHFETKVSQISENLKETKLETPSQLSLLGAPSSSSKLQIDTPPSILIGKSSSSSIKTAPLIEELPGPSTSTTKTTKEALADNPVEHVEHESSSSQTQTTDSIDDPMDHRAKKVRFHPDAKENDGGNRVVPKRKKKMKSSASTSSSTATPSTPIPQCEEQDEEEEIEIDLDEIAAMAEKYLEEHPLTFVPSTTEFRHLEPFTNPLPFGLMVEEEYEEEEEEIVQETKEKVNPDEVVVEDVEAVEKVSHKISPTPDEMQEIVIEAENGVECILGKKTVKNKESYLLRFEGSADLLWESTEYVQNKCPKLLNKYEEYLLLQEDRLLEYLSERQNYRQRYTDF